MSKVCKSKRSALNFEAIPPWHPSRDVIRTIEIPAFLKKMYDYAVSYQTTKGWYLRGVDGKEGVKIFLKVFRMGRYVFVNKTDLLAFLNAQ